MVAGGGAPLPASSGWGGCRGRGRRQRGVPRACCWPGAPCVYRIYWAAAAGGWRFVGFSRAADPACLAVEEVVTGGTKAVGDPTMEEVPPTADPAAARSPRARRCRERMARCEGNEDDEHNQVHLLCPLVLCWSSAPHIISSLLQGASRSLGSYRCWCRARTARC